MERKSFCGEVELSIIGLGGLTLVGMEPGRVGRLVGEAVAAGVNWFDVAPAYGDGEAETRLGTALATFRDAIFLSCKSMQRSAAGAMQDLESSLRRLQTDCCELYSVHSIMNEAEAEQVLAGEGALEALWRARRAGKCRFIGFSSHSVPGALRLLECGAFDFVMFPVNFVCYAAGNFGPQVIRRARQSGTARIALKPLAMTRNRQPLGSRYPNCWYLPIEDERLAGLALRFTLSEDVTAAIPPADESLFRLALRLATGFRPLEPAERSELMRRARGYRPIMSYRPESGAGS